jgi:RNA polymerase sigma-70 factor, ECF subfamily
MSSVTGTAFQPNRPLSPADLAALARLGDRGAYGQIVLLYQDRLYNAMLRLVGDPDEAAELTRQSLARGLATIEQLASDSPYEWLFGIGCNLALSLLHRNRRRRPFHLDDQPEPQRHLYSAMGRLEAEYRAVLVMREIESFDYQRIADVLALPLPTIKSRLFRARLALRDELKGER